ncbi:MAG TPA: 4'-phosphopantetheinyl transferase superfamily protein [Vicinamibacterales bacterium]|nr:4'-phosphopantetheinyl transferase superfamily protein [Vicinamibacterales bacterium]
MTNLIDCDAYRVTLSHDELARCDRFHFPRDRYDFANAHDLLRRTLSRYHITPPHAWRFEVGPYGKPFLSPTLLGEDSDAPLMFNLSHTLGLAACVVTRGAMVGVDLERGEHLWDALALASRFFSPLEVAGLHACGEDDRTHRFLQLWTLKESFIKAIGTGLSQPLESFSFELTEETIRFTPPPEFAPVTSHFAQYEPMPGIVMAIAVCGPPVAQIVARAIEGDVSLETRPTRTTQPTPLATDLSI